MAKEFEQSNAGSTPSYEEDSTQLSEVDSRPETSELKSLMLKDRLTQHSSMDQVFMCKAKVLRVSRDNKTFELEAVVSKERFVAVRASSCLQVPAHGDLVLVQGFEDGSIYVMAVLEAAKDKKQATRFDLTDDAVIDTKSLNFNTTDFKVETKQYSIEASAYSLKANKASVVATQYYLSASNLKQNADKLEVVAKNATSSFTNSLRMVSDTDRVKALNINYSAQSVAKFLGTTTKINNYEFIMSDGKLILVD
ncbi:MAG: DUF3540 domain-containing protein [Alcaligenaceae bacterium]|nr:DUF3540 domain-containing protein [Alcaligenaceae bacterium]